MNVTHQTLGLFKYLSPPKLNFFEKGLLILTPPAYFNDPWDFLPMGRIPSESELLKAAQKAEEIIARSSVIVVSDDFARREKQNRLKAIRNLVSTPEFLAGQSDYYQKKIGENIGVISLAGMPLCRLMWAHYADSHSGFVAEFSAGEESESEGFVFRPMGSELVAVKVKYPRPPQRVVLNENADNVAELCWSKHPLWEYEQEWRIVAELRRSLFILNVDGKGGNRFCVPFKPQNLRRVIFGMRMKPEFKQRLSTMLAQKDFEHVRKEVTTISPVTGELESVPV